MKTTFNITPILEIIISIISLIFSVYILPMFARFLKEKLTEEQRKKLAEWARVAVAAAEQLYKGSGKGAEKKKYVENFLLSKGITVNTEELQAIIEGEVYKLTQGSGYRIEIPEAPEEHGSWFPTTEEVTAEAAE